MRRYLPIRSKGILFVAAAAVSWSLGGLFFRAIELDTWTISFWRSAFATLFLAVACMCIGRGAPPVAVFRQGKYGLFIAIGIAVSMSTFLPALASTSVANVALIYATAPILTAVLGHLWLRERIDGITIGCALGVLVGATLLFLSSGSGGAIFGDLLALVSTVSLVLVALGIRARPQYPLLAYVCLANIIVAVVSLCLAPSLSITWPQAGLLAAFGFVQVALSFTLFTIGARMLPARETALINALEGPLSPLWVWLAFGEELSFMTIASGFIIMSAVFSHIIVQARQHGYETTHSPQPGLIVRLRRRRPA